MKIYKKLLLLLFLIMMVPEVALAYGPGAHIRDAGRFKADLDNGLGGPLSDADKALLSEPEMVRYFELGAFFPDIARSVPDVGFYTHELGFLEHLLVRTESPNTADERALRAFVLGNAAHGMSDISAQVFLVPVLTIRSGVGVIDVFPERMNGDGGENELIVEAIGDFYVGNLHDLVDLFFALVPSAEDPLPLDGVCEGYYGLAEEYFGPLPLTPSQFAHSVESYLLNIAGAVSGLTPDLAHELVNTYSAMSPEDLLSSFLAGNPLVAAGGLDLEEMVIDPMEEARLARSAMISPALHQEAGLWFEQVGAGFLRDYYVSQTLFNEWKIWHGPPLNGAVLTSAGQGQPGITPDDRFLVWELDFVQGEGGGTLSSLELAAPPAELGASLTLYATQEDDIEVEAQVRADALGSDWMGDSVLGSATITVPGFSPDEPPQRVSLYVPISLPADSSDISRLYLTLRVDGEVSLVTLEEALIGNDELDLTRAVWGRPLRGSTDWQPTLEIIDPSYTSAVGTLDVRVRNQRIRTQPVPFASFSLGEERMTTNGVGRSWLTEVPVGEGVIDAGLVEANSYEALAMSVPYEVLEGYTTVVEILMEPVPTMTWDSPYTKSDTLRGWIQDSAFNEDDPFLVSLGEGAMAGGEYMETGRRVQLEVPEGAVDATPFFAYLKLDEPGAPRGMSGPIILDRSPPEVVVEDNDWIEDFSLSFYAEDLHSPVTYFSLEVVDADGEIYLEREERRALEEATFDLSQDFLLRGADLEGLSALHWTLKVENAAGAEALLEGSASRSVVPDDITFDEDTSPEDLGGEDIAEDSASDDALSDLEPEETSVDKGDDCSCALSSRQRALPWGLLGFGLLLGLVRTKASRTW